MPSTISMLRADYDKIVSVYESLKSGELATNEEVTPLLYLLKTALAATDSTNTLTRHYMWVKWYDLSARPADYEDYPPQIEESLYSYTAFTRQYIVDFVLSQTPSYANILVTNDPSGQVGWMELDIFFS